MKHGLAVFAALILLGNWADMSWASPTDPPLRFGILVQNMSVTSPSDILIAVRPLADYLEEQLSRKVEVRIFETCPQMDRAFARSEIDVGYASDREYVTLKKGHGHLRPFAKPTKMAGPRFDVLQVTRKAEGLDALSSLRGLRLACHSRLSSTSYLIPRVMLARAGFEVPERFFGSLVKTKKEANGIYAIAFSKADVVFVSNHIFDLVCELKPKIRRIVNVRNLSKEGWGPLCFGPMFARGDLPRSTVDVVQKELLAMRESDPRSRMILLLFRISGFVAAEDGDYDGLRRLMRSGEEAGHGN